MRKFLFLFALLLTVATIEAQKKAAVDRRLVGIDTALNKLLADWKIAGFAVAVVEKGKVIYSQGFGYRDLENKKPVTPNTLFAIGSCTKAFTSSLLGILEKDGSFSFDKKAAEYLPSLYFYNDAMNNTITARDMASHRTGLPRHDYAWYLFPTSSRDTLLQRIRHQEPSAGIRERFQYNNFMFLAQGMIAEKITGKSWENNIKERIFTPLGMTRSNFSIADLQKDADASLGYGLRKDSIIRKLDYFNIDAMGPAGSINSSVTEMAQWVISWINGGNYQGREVLPAAYTKSAMGSQMVVGPGLPGSPNPDIHFSNYGLGWFLGSYRGHYRVEHGGNIDGFSASTCFFPSDSIGIVVLTNQNGSSVPSIARNLIADRMLKLPYINWSKNLKADADKAKAQAKEMEKNKTSSRVTGTRPSHKLSEYEGIYSHPAYGEFEIFERRDTLIGRVGKDSFWLRHFHYDVFDTKGYDPVDGIDTTEGGLKLNFRTNEMGKIEGLLMPLEPSLKPLEFTYKPKAKAIGKEELEKYVGEWEMAGMTAKTYLKNDMLHLFVEGQPEYELQPAGNHTFLLKIVKGFSLKFDVNEKGEVPGVSFIQPNGTFKATRKK